MATGDYCDLGELKRSLWADNVVPDNLNDPELERVISAASRGIDAYTGTRFYTTEDDETRYFTPKYTNRLWVAALISLTSLSTDDSGNRSYGTTWTVDVDYELYPWNASLDGLPYSWICTILTGSYHFPRANKSTKLVGKFGWSSETPALVKEACVIQSIRWVNRPNAPFGVVGPQGLGQVSTIPVTDPDIQSMLASFRINIT